MRTGAPAVPAADAFRTVGRLVDRDIQLTRLLARTAARAFFLVNAEPVERGRIEQPVYGAERAEITAERPVYQQGKQQQSGKDRGFPGEQPAERGSQRRIGGNQRDAREQRAGGADVFAEPRLSLPDNIQHGQGQHDDKACKDDVFQIFEPAVAGQAAQLFDKGDFIQQVLHQPERTKPAAYQPAEQRAEQE